jgi:hypothetical protein
VSFARTKNQQLITSAGKQPRMAADTENRKSNHGERDMLAKGA